MGGRKTGRGGEAKEDKRELLREKDVITEGGSKCVGEGRGKQELGSVCPVK